LKESLGEYAVLGNEHSFDEGTTACRSSYGRHLITFNATKPTGKFHFKLYMLCCAVTNLVHKLKVHSRDKSDFEEESDDMVSKIDNLTLQICKGLYNTGSTINIDNYYMSTTCAIRLREKGVFCRGTI
jgi:Transposase IS4